MKTVAEFKRRMQVGTKVHTLYHKEFNGRTTNGEIIYKTKDLGIRPVSIVQTTQFAFETKKTDGTTSDSWCSFPKLTDCRFEGEDTIVILDLEGSDLLTYTFVKL